MASSASNNAAPAGGYVVHGYTAKKRTGRLVAFAALPVQRAVTLRETATFRRGRTPTDEAYVAQMLGDVQERNDACAQCRLENGPFSLCVTVEGHFGEACANCAYRSAASRCSIRISKFTVISKPCVKAY